MEKDTEEVLSLMDLQILDVESMVEGISVIGDEEGSHYHWDPETQFYNHCHGKAGKFCPTHGGGGGGKDTSGNGSKETGTGVSGKTKIGEAVKKAGSAVAKEVTKGPTSSKATNVLIKTIDGVSGQVSQEGTGKHGASLIDPHAGTRTIDGVKGYDSKGKPVAGTDAWLEAHGITRTTFEARPYVKYEANKTDPALIEAYAGYPKAQKFFLSRAEQEGQNGGYLMYKHEAPGSPSGHIAPQARPNEPIITDASKHAKARTILANERIRLETLKKTTPAALRAERRAQLKHNELNLERIKKATPETIRAEAEKNYTHAKDVLAKAKAKGDDVAILDAKGELVKEKRQYDRDLKRARQWNPEKELYDAELHVKNAKTRLQRSIDDPKGALASEIKNQEQRVERYDNRFKKTAAKYVFPPGTSSARIDMNQDPQNVRNLKSGKGRIYFAMEGSIKADAILTTAKKEDPTAAVVNVPSVTLWQQNSALTGGVGGGVSTSELKWFAGKYGKGREIILIPDADGITNPNVRMQAKAMSTALKSSGVGRVIIAAPPLRAGTTKQVDHFNLPSGVDEGRKGIDDHLGAGRGSLSQLQYSQITRVPKYDLSEYTKAAGGDGPKINKNARAHTEAALAAISGIAGPEGSTRMPKKMLAQTANLPLTSAKEARDRLEKLGIIKVEHIYDEGALSRGKRIRNPKVSDERVNELVRAGIIKRPSEQPFTEVNIEESPVVTILDKRFLISPENVHNGVLADLPSWSPPKSYKGWTSPVTGKKDTSGIETKLKAQQTKAVEKKNATITNRVVPEGRKVVRTQAGAKKYGVSVGDLVPIQEASSIGSQEASSIGAQILTSLILIPKDIETEADLIEFYNHHHGKDGKFAPGSGGGGGSGSSDSGSKGSGVSGKASLGTWPSSKGRNITVVAKTNRGSVKVDGIKAKAVYEVTAANGNKIRLYDKTGEAGKYYKDLLNNHARMNEMYPKPVHNIIITKPTKGLDKRDFSSVNSQRNETYINSHLLGFDIKAIRAGYLMPSARSGNTKNMDYLLTHEYGHHVDFSKHVDGDNHSASPLYGDPAFKTALSTYGKKSPIEAYAEAFAEWHYTRGRTQNPAAVALARYEGWNGTAGINASGSIDSLIWDGYNVISMINKGLVHFANEGDNKLAVGEMFPDDTEDDIYADIPADENGITVLDDFESKAKVIGAKEVEPTADEVAKATNLIKAVFIDLGLDYEAYSRGEVG